EPRQSGTPFEQPWPLAAWPEVPTKALTCRHDRLFPADFQRRVLSGRLGISTEEMDGGHCVAWSRPEELASRLCALAGSVLDDDGTAGPNRDAALGPV